MKKYLIKRFLLLIPTLLGISIITFAIVHLAPGDPAVLNQGGIMSARMSTDAVERVREMYGLDRPLIVQYVSWLERLITLDFGNSFQDGRPVITRISERLPITITLNFISLLLIYVISIPIGVYSAKYNKAKREKVTTTILFMLYSLPSFWVGLILMVIFGVRLNILPIYGITSINFEQMTFFGKVFDIASHLVLPVITMVYAGFAFLSRFVKNGMLDVLGEDYILMARAKGVSENKIYWKHALRNALIPVITLFATTLPALIGGSVIIETIFSIPGIGLLYYDAIFARDYPVVMGLSFITALLTLVSLVLADILYTIADPRINFDKNFI